MSIEVKDLKVNIAAKEIVKGVSFLVENKQFAGIIGPNGSGKSTLLKAIYRVLKPSGGIIMMNNTPIDKLNGKTVAKNMGVVGQFNSINFEFSVKEIVLMGRTPHKSLLETDSKEDFEIVYDSLEKVGMLDYKDRNFSYLSGGEKQRIILARALAQKPKILILDEPTNHLDIKYQLQILSIVKKLDICVLCALHDLSLASQYCDCIFIMKDGNLIRSGKPADIITKDMIREIYNVEANVIKDDVTDNIYVHYYG